MVKRYDVRKLINQYNLDYLERKIYKDREYIIKEGQEIKSLYLITKGKVKISQTFPNGKAYMIGINGTNYVLGDVEFVSNTNASSSVQSIGTTEVLILPFSELKSKYIKEYDFMYGLFVNLSFKLLESSEINTLNIIYPVKVRLASFLLSISIDGHKVRVRNYSDVANNIGCSYRHLHRALKGLVDVNVIQKERYGIKILDKKGLLEIAQGNIYEGNN